MQIKITEIGYVVIPATLAFLLLRPRLLLGWTLFLSVFQAAAVIVVQPSGRYPIGLQPVFFAGPLAVLAWFLSRRPARWFTPGLIRLCMPVYLFAGFAVGSALFFPKAFQGLLVESPREGVGTIQLVPLHLSLTNLSVAVYLLCCVLFFLIVVEETAASPRGVAGRHVVGWTLAGICTAAAVGFYQVLAPRSGLAFPHKLFDSNPAYAQLYAAAVAGQIRLTGTFTEASVAAWFFGAGTVLCLWQVLFARGRGWYLAGLACSGPALVLTESSTGYLILIGIALLVPLRLAWLRRAIAGTVAALMAAVAFLLAFAAWTLQDFRYVHRLLNDLLFGKWRTGSYFQRAFSNRVAYHVFLATHGLGAGWGSLRASSLAATLLGTVGAIGVALALWFLLRLVRLEWRVRCLAQVRFPFREGLIVTLLLMLGAGFISVTDMLFYLPFWALAGVLTALVWGEAAWRRRQGGQPMTSLRPPQEALHGAGGR